MCSRWALRSSLCSSSAARASARGGHEGADEREANDALDTVRRPQVRLRFRGRVDVRMLGALVRQIVRHSGYRVTGTTGSAWVAAGRGRDFFIWATRASRSVELVAKRGGYRLVGRVAAAPVYDDGVRTFWPARGFIFWVAPGPRGDSTAPTASELEPIVRASRTVSPPLG